MGYVAAKIRANTARRNGRDVVRHPKREADDVIGYFALGLGGALFMLWRATRTDQHPGGGASAP